MQLQLGLNISFQLCQIDNARKGGGHTGWRRYVRISGRRMVNVMIGHGHDQYIKFLSQDGGGKSQDPAIALQGLQHKVPIRQECIADLVKF
jgi:hypothetical protein